MLDFDAGHVLTLLGQGRLDDAKAICGKRLDSVPNDPHAAALLGMACAAKGEFPEAVRWMRHGLALAPSRIDLRINLANLLLRSGTPGEAIVEFRAVAADSCASADQLAEAAEGLVAAGADPEAETVFRASLDRGKTFRAHLGLGCLLHRHGWRQDAGYQLLEAHRLDQHHGGALNQLGIVLREMGRDADAVQCFELAATLHGHPALWGNLAGCLVRLRRFAEAEAAFAKARIPGPEGDAIQHKRAIMTLLTGDWPEGFRQAECRFTSPDFPDRMPPGELWRGEPLDGRRLMVWGEQGLGDRLQFVRFARELAKSGASVTVGRAGLLTSMFDRIEELDAVHEGTPPPESYDVHVPMMSLGGLMGATPDNIASEVPYLTPSPAMCEEVRPFVRSLPGFKVGLVWRGNPKQANDIHRSIPLEKLTPLFALDGVSFVSLQHAPLEVDRPFMERLAIPPVIGIEEVAALIHEVDMVMSVDTGIAHMAGALGARMWVLLSWTPDWRWLLDREDSPWYPTARLFRQPSAGDWESVIARVARELQSSPR